MWNNSQICQFFTIIFLKGLQATKLSANILKGGNIGQPNTTNLNRNVVIVTNKKKYFNNLFSLEFVINVYLT